MTVSAGQHLAGDAQRGPFRAPLACGALGRYERERVLDIGARLGAEMRTVHEDDASLLMLDREPIAWQGRRERGLGWVEGQLELGGADSWQEAGQRGWCGLVARGKRRFLHSSVDGVAPLYWIVWGDAVYFASRIDPLVLASPRRLSVDWDAWASIIALRFPCGDSTPFAEIRRLGPFSTLDRRLGRVRARSPAWPWAEVEPRVGLGEAAEEIASGIVAALRPLEAPALCPLSGGRDSRMLLCALDRTAGADAAVTVGDDEGDTFEEDLAAPVAAAIGVPHERLGADERNYPADWELRAQRVEYQFVDHAWLVPLARHLEERRSVVADGFAIDSLLQRGARFYPPETLDHRRPRRAIDALFDEMRKYGLAHRALEERFHEPLAARAREAFQTATRPFRGHPSQATLAFYATRTVRGVSTYPSGLLGTSARVLVPGASDAVATAALGTDPGEKEGDRLYGAVFDRLCPAAGRLPASGDTPRRPPRLPRRWRSDPAVAAHRERLENGPLAPHLSTELRAWLASPERGELSGDLRLGMEAVSLFHAWFDRYRDKLRDVDPADLAG